jgi:SUMO ligase MMS21 Smc5/6 complex component
MLDGRSKVVKEGSEEKIVVEPYVFSAQTRMALARNFAALQVEQQIYANARVGLAKQFADGKPEVPQERLADFQAELSKLLSDECGASLVVLTEVDLNLATNPLPPTVIAALLPLLAAPEV